MTRALHDDDVAGKGRTVGEFLSAALTPVIALRNDLAGSEPTWPVWIQLSIVGAAVLAIVWPTIARCRRHRRSGIGSIVR